MIQDARVFDTQEFVPPAALVVASEAPIRASQACFPRTEANEANETWPFVLSLGQRNYRR
jgi:hypothetical protein